MRFSYTPSPPHKREMPPAASSNATHTTCFLGGFLSKLSRPSPAGRAPFAQPHNPCDVPNLLDAFPPFALFSADVCAHARLRARAVAAGRGGRAAATALHAQPLTLRVRACVRRTLCAPATPSMTTDAHMNLLCVCAARSSASARDLASACASCSLRACAHADHNERASAQVNQL